jgi:hypothetical protein
MFDTGWRRRGVAAGSIDTFCNGACGVGGVAAALTRFLKWEGLGIEVGVRGWRIATEIEAGTRGWRIATEIEVGE